MDGIDRDRAANARQNPLGRDVSIGLAVEDENPASFTVPPGTMGSRISL